jgi:8-oxo-dGTP pyrophosphatase MutT (NUDIX family)
MLRHTRIQGLIIQNHKILLIRCYEWRTSISFWVIPGGGHEPGETDEECAIREMKEETGLDVRVGKLLIEQEAYPGGMYKRLKSYICTPIGGQLEPGSEPENEVDIEITAVRWFDLKDISPWSADLCLGQFNYPQLQNIRQLLGYTTKI